jgi:hypothetical protein
MASSWRENQLVETKKTEHKGELMVWRIKVYAKAKVVLFFIFHFFFIVVFLSLLFKFCENGKHAMD